MSFIKLRNRRQRCTDSKTFLLQRNSPVLNWACRQNCCVRVYKLQCICTNQQRIDNIDNVINTGATYSGATSTRCLLERCDAVWMSATAAAAAAMTSQRVSTKSPLVDTSPEPSARRSTYSKYNWIPFVIGPSSKYGDSTRVRADRAPPPFRGTGSHPCKNENV